MASLILASRSPQRHAILRQIGIRFDSVIPEVEELEHGHPTDLAVENASRKASAVRGATVPVLGVDTVVSLEGQPYGKPRDLDDARATLRALSGRRHTVLGGVCLIEQGRRRTAVAATTVEFGQLSDETIEWYLASGEWRERAGGYAIQGRGAALVSRVEGDYLNVVGLPLWTLLELAPWLLVAREP